MKYLICYTAKRKNAKRHVEKLFGKTKYFDTIEDAKKYIENRNKDLYNYTIYNTKWELIETL